MDSESSVVKKNTPSIELATYAVNTIYHPNEQADYIHVKLLPFLDPEGQLKFLLKISNPSFDPLPPLNCKVTLRTLQFNLKDNGKENITSHICEHLFVDSLPENGSVQFEVFAKDHSALLKPALSLTVDCFPFFNSEDATDWHSPPLYTTVLTAFDLLLDIKEITKLHIKPEIIPLSSPPKDSAIDITARQAMKLVLKEVKDITEADILDSLFHYKWSKFEKPFSGFVFMNNCLIEVQITVTAIVPRRNEDAFRIQIFTNESERIANLTMFCQLRKKLHVLLEDSSFAVYRSSRPATVIWKPQISKPQNFDFAYVGE